MNGVNRRAEARTDVAFEQEGAAVIDLEIPRFVDLAAANTDESDTALVQRLDTLREELMMGIATFIDPAPLLEDPSNWNIESLRIVGAVTEQALEVSDMSASKPCPVQTENWMTLLTCWNCRL